MRKRVSLRDVADRVDYGLTTSAVADGPGPRFLRITDIDRSFVDWSAVPRCQASPSQVAKYELRTGDIVVARTGASTGRSQWVRVNDAAVFESYLVRFRVSSDYCSRFVGYVLSSAPWRDHIASVAHGKSAQPNMSASEMVRFEFECPSLREQEAIADVLAALDDKIVANVELVETIDRLAKATFDHMVTDVETIPLTYVARFVNGKAFTKGASGTGRIVIRIAELNSGIGGSTIYNDIEVADQHVARPGDLLFAWSGSLTLHRWFRPEAIVNQHIFKVIPTDDYPTWCAHSLIARKLDEFKAIAADKATTMGHIQRRHLEEPVEVPVRSAIERSDELMSALWNRALLAEQESLTLGSVRDALLPQLISGKLRVKDAEKTVEEVL